MPIQTNLDTKELPVREEEHRLPSGGVLYGGLWDSGVVTVRPYSFMVEGTLVSNRKWHEKMNTILTEVTDFPAGFQVEDLLVGDAYFIFAVARALTYGEVYNFTSKCPDCGHTEKHQMKVPEELPVHCWFPEETLHADTIVGDANSPDNVFRRGGSLYTDRFLEVDLPASKDTIRLQFPTLRGDRELAERFATMAALSSRAGGDEGATASQEIARIAAHIKSVNGTRGDNMFEMEEHVRRIKGPDMVAIYDAIKSKACGITFNGDVTCDACSSVYPHELPLRHEFFRRGRS